MSAATMSGNSVHTGHAETSPLLGSHRNADDSKTVVPLPNADPRHSVGEEATSNGADAAREAQFQGLPEAQRQLKYIVPAISVGVFLAAADQTVISASYGKIGSDFQALNLTSWIATSYFLTLTSFQPLYGRLSDIFGRKSCLLFAYAVFGIGCVLCGLARNINELIAARAFQGVGGGGMTTVVSILMSDIVPLRDRGVWQGIINIIYAAGSGIGAPLGGVLCDFIGWRWAFLVQGPFCLVAFICVTLSLNLPVTEKSDWQTKLRRVDFLGALVLVGAVFCFLLGLDRGSNVSWSIPVTITSLCVSVTLFAMFLYVEMCIASEPFAPGHVIFEWSLFACYACNFFSFGGWLAGIFYLPLYFQAADGVSATGAGLRLVPAIVAGVSGSLFGGVIMKKTGKYFWLTVAGYTSLTVGVLVISLFSGAITNNTPGIICGMVMGAFGNGIGVTTTLVGLIAHASPQDQAIATACTYLFRSLGSVIGLSLCSTIMQQSLRISLRSALHGSNETDKIVDGVRQSLDFVKTLDPETRRLVRECYGHAINKGFVFMIGVVFLSLLSTFFIREQKLSL